jgi:hypothetical protein
MLKRIFSFLFALLLLIFTSPRPAQAQYNQQTQFGTNVGAPVYYSADGLYTDLFIHGTGWWTNPNTSIPLTADGYPAYPANDGKFCTTLIYLDGYQSGDFQFYGEGDFNIQFRGARDTGYPNNGAVPGTQKKAGNVTTALVHYDVAAPQYGGLGSYPTTETLIDIEPTGPNPITNLHLVAPGYPAYPNNPEFSNLYIQAASPFKCLRVMDWMGTNGSTVTSWASRPNPNFFGDGNQNVAYERFIDLANQTNSDLWICVPLNATDDWASNMAQLLANRLKPNLHVYYEISNELWNWGAAYWTDWNQVEQAAQSNPALTAPMGSWARHGQQMAYLLMHYRNIIQPILPSARPILGGQFGNGYATDGLAWINQTYGPPSAYIFGWAGAPYFGPSSADPNPSDLDSLFTSMDDNLNSSIIPGIQQGCALARQYGIQFCCYEGGQGLASSDPNAFALYQAAQYDPRMGTLYQKLAQAHMANGTYLCNFYGGFGGHDSQWGFWSSLTDIRFVSANPQPVKYAAEAAAAMAGGSNGSGGGSGGGGNGSGGGGTGGGYYNGHNRMPMPPKNKMLPIKTRMPMPPNGHPGRQMPIKIKMPMPPNGHSG